VLLLLCICSHISQPHLSYISRVSDNFRYVQYLTSYKHSETDGNTSNIMYLVGPWWGLEAKIGTPTRLPKLVGETAWVFGQIEVGGCGHKRRQTCQSLSRVNGRGECKRSSEGDSAKLRRGRLDTGTTAKKDQQRWRSQAQKYAYLGEQCPGTTNM
jgi:hypothetical protein